MRILTTTCILENRQIMIKNPLMNTKYLKHKM